MNKIHRQDIDFLKGIAILGVVLYHIGILPAGYLGVDIFFVVNGFLVIPSLCTKLENGEFQYWFFIKRKLMRMYPLLLVACTISLILAIFFMLPDDLLTTAESVVASLFFLNNRLSLFLTRDYWDWTNDFKPLMHIWYLSILVQIYFILPCFMLLGNKIAKKINLSKGVVYKTILIFISILSVILFINPNLSSWNRFYLVQYRIFEFTVGGIAGVFCNEYRNSDKVSNVTNTVNILINILCYGIIICILLGGGGQLDSNVRLLSIVFTTMVYLLLNRIYVFSNLVSVIAYCGKSSWIIYIWHQVVLAWYRYLVSTKIDVIFTVAFFISLSILLMLSNILEKKFNDNVIKDEKIFDKRTIGIIGYILVICMFSFGIWVRAGIVRDIPELEISVENIDRRKFPHYVDRVYDMSKPFDNIEKDKLNVLTIGNSYARDFSNILLESELKDNIDLSYSFGVPYGDDRVKQSDIIFVFGEKDLIENEFWQDIPEDVQVWGVGTKNYGSCNGSILLKKYWMKDKIYNITVNPFIDPNGALEVTLKEQWGDYYISLMDIVRANKDEIFIFTDDHKFISYDCYHLTPAGARYYARIINWKEIFGEKYPIE